MEISAGPNLIKIRDLFQEKATGYLKTIKLMLDKRGYLYLCLPPDSIAELSLQFHFFSPETENQLSFLHCLRLFCLSLQKTIQRTMQMSFVVED